MFSRFITAGAAAAVILCLALPAQARPPVRKHTPYSAYNHNGFLVRLAAGFGYTRAGRDGDDELVLAGGGGMASIAFGGMIARNLALNLDIFGSSAFEPSVVVNGQDIGDADDTTMSIGAVGIGVTYYLTPANVYFAASFGAAKGVIETRYRFLGATVVEKSESDVGFAINVMIGKEWWVGPEWGIGVAGQLIIGTLPGDVGDIHPFAVGVCFTATYN